MATRFYLPATVVSTPISPTPDSAWEDVSAIGRNMMRPKKIGDAMTTVSFGDSDATDKDVILRQFISEQLTPGQTITGGQTLKAQARYKERATSCNMFPVVGCRVINGSTVQKTILAVTRGVGNELDATTLTNRGASTSSVAGNYTTVAGDRIVLEMGAGGDPAAGSDHDYDLRLGDAASSDLPENSTATTDDNPWFEMADTLTMSDEIAKPPFETMSPSMQIQ